MFLNKYRDDLLSKDHAWKVEQIHYGNALVDFAKTIMSCVEAGDSKIIERTLNAPADLITCLQGFYNAVEKRKLNDELINKVDHADRMINEAVAEVQEKAKSITNDEVLVSFIKKNITLAELEEIEGNTERDKIINLCKKKME